MDTQKVFVNRILNMKKIKLIGVDMDHTLIRYHSEKFEGLVYDLIKEKLVSHKLYPEQIKQLHFNYQDAIRGLVIDTKNGNILKLSRYGAIRQSYHGTRPIDFTTQQEIYRSIYVDLGDHNYMPIDTSFSISFCVLFAQLIDLKD
ncbi:MAG: 5'-nucleotidase domain-containing protein, partial [bacterium]|nr:5'-nucleotidase domain-containing protein [bacterium]